MEKEITDILKSMSREEIDQAILDQNNALYQMQEHMSETQRKINILNNYISDTYGDPQTGLQYPNLEKSEKKPIT